MNRSLLSRSYLFDRLIAGYSLLMILAILLLGRPLNQYVDEIFFYTGVVVLVTVIVHWLSEDQGGMYRLLRLLYPLILFTFLYRTTGGLMFLLFDGFFDGQLCAFEKSLFGVNPTLYIDRNLLSPWLTEPISLCYFSYYLMIPVFFITAYVRGSYALIRSAMSAICIMFFLSYLLFFLYPIEGPRWHFVGLYQNAVEGSVFRQLVEIVIEKGAVRGGCMPSSHFGVALVLLMYTFRYYARSVAWTASVFTLGLGVGTVWGRFHYVSDVVVGGLLGLIATLVIWKYSTDKQVQPRSSIRKEANNVS
ncbi:MAG: phosphatase PAP2 family protein [candidate division Zixibacteria bacterium]|nr:phosphatase PAP2 family protein [candidate division Zixibacteria bacterium]